jgi:hypothetical protein
VLALVAGCSSSLDNGPRRQDEAPVPGGGEAKLRFPSQEIAAKYKAAKASPQNVELVLDYGRSVVLFCLASLLDTSCTSCEGDLPVYRARSELNTAYWPIIEDALPMLEPFMEGHKLEAGQLDLLVEVKGRLLWLAGRSSEEQTIIDSYAIAHPNSLAIVKRRLEILRDAHDAYFFDSQCTRSRSRMRSAAEAERLELLTSCVALHPNNGEARSDAEAYATFLPNLSPDEAALYRTHLVQRCTERVGDDGERCAETCACESEDAGKSPSAKCKRACGGCRNETAQEVLACKKLGEVAPDPAPVRRGHGKSSHVAASQ